MKKILLCGMKYDKNFGDPIINECCKSIIEDILDSNNITEYKIEEIDLCGRSDFNTLEYLNRNIIFYIKKIIFKVISKINNTLLKGKCSKIYNFLDMVKWYFTEEYTILHKNYKNKIEEADVIIFVGGGMIKYKYQNCYHYINFVSKIANNKNIPICLNAVGVEGYDEKNIKCRMLKKALNRKCVKMITIRDDIEKLNKYIVCKDIITKKVSDPAVYTNRTYNIEKNKNSEIIGLGVCRSNLFIDNDINYNEENLLNLWKNIIDTLDRNKIKWKIYTNGLEDDNKFAIKLINKLKLDEHNLVIPNSPEELVKIVSNFKAIIATRLHSCIVAYSLNIPAVGLVWNRKLKMFGESIGYEERFIEVENFNDKFIVEILKKALQEEYNKISQEEYIKSERETLENFLNLY